MQHLVNILVFIYSTDPLFFINIDNEGNLSVTNFAVSIVSKSCSVFISTI